MTPFYERDGITIYCGDCLDVMPVLDGLFDAIIADLPYGTTACSWDTVIPFEPLWEQYKRLTRGAVVLFGSQPFTGALVMSCPEWFRQSLVWEKNKATGHLNANIAHLRAHEDIVIFYDTFQTYNPVMGNGVAYSNHHKRGDSGDCYGDVKESKRENVTARYPRSVIKFDVDTKAEYHPTQKPVALLAYLIRTYTNPGEIVLDNTMGSGTTLVAAQRLGRQAVGIEISEEYCRIAVERLRQRSLWQIAPIESAPPEPEQGGLL